MSRGEKEGVVQEEEGQASKGKWKQGSAVLLVVMIITSLTFPVLLLRTKDTITQSLSLPW